MRVRIGNHLVVDLLDKLSPNFMTKYNDLFELIKRGRQNNFELTNRFLIDMNASHEEAF
jgi:hypothetical protein